jgi:hypothetical protein
MHIIELSVVAEHPPYIPALHLAVPTTSLAPTKEYVPFWQLVQLGV